MKSLTLTVTHRFNLDRPDDTTDTDCHTPLQFRSRSMKSPRLDKERFNLRSSDCDRNEHSSGPKKKKQTMQENVRTHAYRDDVEIHRYHDKSSF